MTIIESNVFDAEVDALLTEGVVTGMYRDLGREALLVDMDSWDFIKTANHVYHRRGGSEALTVGGPARAMKRLRREAE